MVASADAVGQLQRRCGAQLRWCHPTRYQRGHPSRILLLGEHFELVAAGLHLTSAFVCLYSRDRAMAATASADTATIKKTAMAFQSSAPVKLFPVAS